MENTNTVTQVITARVPLPLYLRLSAEVVRRRSQGDKVSRADLVNELMAEFLPGINVEVEGDEEK